MAKKKSEIKYYVLFGFDKYDASQTGYFSNDNFVTSELSAAKVFPSKNIYKIKGFGSPEKWLEFINSDRHLNNGYKFHLVSVKNPN